MKNIWIPSEANFTRNPGNSGNSGNSENSDSPQAVFGCSDFQAGEDFGFYELLGASEMFIFKKFLARLEVLKRDTLRFQNIPNFQTRQKLLENGHF